jgi:hypothetical protein
MIKMLIQLHNQRRREDGKKIDYILTLIVIYQFRNNKDLKVKNSRNKKKTLILSDKNFILKCNNYIKLAST